MSQTEKIEVFTLRVPSSLAKLIRNAASRERQSVNQFLSSSAEDIIQHRSYTKGYDEGYAAGEAAGYSQASIR